jgi:hypothetical protein
MTDFYLTGMGHKFYNHDVPRIANALETIGDALTVQTAAPQMLAALKLAHPLLIRLGDFIGNGEHGDDRCAAVLAVYNAIAKAEGREQS